MKAYSWLEGGGSGGGSGGCYIGCSSKLVRLVVVIVVVIVVVRVYFYGARGGGGDDGWVDWIKIKRRRRRRRRYLGRRIVGGCPRPLLNMFRLATSSSRRRSARCSPHIALNTEPRRDHIVTAMRLPTHRLFARPVYFKAISR
ncbi:unnamed protein product [Soboliphyme baturini]|uniref:Transmembrane protein n=1 Tax=Soboliphyme baturini TaxID=241478 RepID=A0A183ICG5_9BILA|nr:unnamed protein product [Soboliphyme baturini]